ncbi:hypothetical protein BDZ85DRAFT_250015 [Elsinoe ampelina]|uniref:C2H2-type domain-containing protein n=1 Tax=Elsinoe ampelina TaxID=302913 RepID=A0A6A6GBG3_9PEZI|nr:hypothetical protein BDZ85DRAFT_250015 [Elsinoe ampelina]
MQSKEAERTAKCPNTGRDDFEVSFVAVPASSLGPWKVGWKRWFQGKLDLWIWYGSKDTAAAADVSKVLPPNAEGLNKWLEDHVDINDPKTARKVILTSTSTMTSRCLQQIRPASTRDQNVEAKGKERQRPEDYPEDMCTEDAADYEAMQDEVDNTDEAAWRILVDRRYFRRIVVDEAHLYKGRHTQIHICIRKLKFAATILLTGTPFTRRLTDFAGLLALLWNDTINEEYDEQIRSRTARSGIDAYKSMRDEVEEFVGSTDFEQIFADENIRRFIPMFCPDCGRIFTGQHASQACRVHELEHTNRFKCEVCDKQCVGASKLREHMAMHNKSNDFKCELCGVTASAQSAIWRHMRNFHPSWAKPTFTCAHCGKVGKQEHHMKMHEEACFEKAARAEEAEEVYGGIEGGPQGKESGADEEVA